MKGRTKTEKENPQKRLFLGVLAEKAGFEPASPCGLRDFQSRSL